MIKKQDSIIVKEQFGVEFHYSNIPNFNGLCSLTKKGEIKVYRLNTDEVLQTIRFWDDDVLKTKQQFADACTVWCDQHAA